MNNNMNLKLLLEIYTLKIRFKYSEEVCSGFYEKVYNYLFNSSDEYKPIIESILHLVAFAKSNFERRLLRGFYHFVKSYM